MALASTLFGAGLISLTRVRAAEKIPQAAYIGIIYAVSSAAMILVLTQVPHGGEEIRHLLVGALLWVSWPEVIKTAVLCAILSFVVTSRVQIAGVLLVFCLLVVPTVMGIRILQDPRRQFIFTLVVGTVAVVVGAGISYGLDLATGAAIVCTFGVFLAVQVILEAMLGRRSA